MVAVLRFIIFSFLVTVSVVCCAQKPVISYNTPQNYTLGPAITPLIPSNTGGLVGSPTPIVLGSGFNNLTSIAVDVAGNVYFTVNGSDAVKKIPAGGGSAIMLGSGFSTPTGITVDGMGNVYVADFGHNAIKKIPVGGGAIVTIGSGFHSPYGIIIDDSGNLFVSDRGSNTIKKIPSSGGAPVIYASGFDTPAGLAVDDGGNIYVADQGHHLIKKISVAGNTDIVASGYPNINGVAVDTAGNVYFADTYNTSIIKILKTDGNAVNIGSGFIRPTGVALSTSGDIYIADNGNLSIKEVRIGGYTIDHNLPKGLIFNSLIGVISGSPSAVSPAEDYVVTASNSTGSSNFSIMIKVGAPQKPVIAYTSPQAFVYTAGTVISALIPSNSGDTVRVGGFGISPALPAGLNFDVNTGEISGTPYKKSASANYTVIATNAGGADSTKINIAINNPSKPVISYSTPQVYTNTVPILPLSLSNSVGVVSVRNVLPLSIPTGFIVDFTMDGAGNIYFIEANPSYTLKKIPAGTTTAIVIADLSQDFITPDYLAVDNKGNIYIEDRGQVKRIPAGGGTPVMFSPDHYLVNGMKTDAIGNVYIADDSKITKTSADGSNVTVISNDRNITPTNLAVDAAGNIYFTELNQACLIKIPAGSSNIIILAEYVFGSGGITLDALGNIYTFDDYGSIIEFPASGGARSAVVSSLNTPRCLAADAVGNLYFSDYEKGFKFINTGGYFISPALPRGLNLDAATGTISGTPAEVSSSKIYTVTTANAAGYSSTKVNITVKHYPLPVVKYETPKIYRYYKTINSVIPQTSYVDPSAARKLIVAGTGLPNLGGVAADNLGNIYFAQTDSNVIKKIPANGGAPLIVASHLSAPTGVAADASGNIYFTETETNLVRKIPANGGPIITVASGFNAPCAVTVTSSGDLFVANKGNGSIQKIAAGNNTAVTVGPRFVKPAGIAVDAVGNIYIADAGANTVFKFVLGSASAIPVAYCYSNPLGVVTDAWGNIYYVESGDNSIKLITRDPSQPESIAGGGSTTTAIAIDSKGVFYICDPGKNNINAVTPVGGFFIDKLLPAGLNFDVNTGEISGTPLILSPAKNYTVYAYNRTGVASATINVSVIPSPSLIALTINVGAVSPIFYPDIREYNLSVANTVSSVTFQPTSDSPISLITINGVKQVSGVTTKSLPLTIGLNVYAIAVTDSDGTDAKNYKINIFRAAPLSTNALLTSIKVNPVTTLTTVIGPDFRDYTTTVPNSETSVKITPTTQDATATIKVNGVTVASGTASASIPLNVGDNVINTIVTAQDGTTTKTYSIKFTRLPSSNANLAGLALSSGTLSPVFAAGTTSYTATTGAATITVTPTAGDAGATIKVNGTVVASGAASAALPLIMGANVISIAVTAQDGVTTKTYTVTITRVSNNALLTSIRVTPVTTLTTVSGPDFRDYTTTVPNSESTVKITPTVQDATATVKVNGVTVASGTASGSIALNVGTTVVNTVVTAQDGITTKTYSITFTRTGPVAGVMKYDQQEQSIITDALTVHQNVSPNGDGNSDVLVIDGIAAYPENKLQIMSRSGALIYEAKGYNNTTNVFDGHSSSNGKLQQAGTYMYSLEYKDGGEVKYKTGFIILKY